MRRSFLAAMAATALAFGMTAPTSVHAATELSECTEANLWSVEAIDQPVEGGYAQFYYLCTPDGWMFVGSTYCSGGNCSSD